MDMWILQADDDYEDDEGDYDDSEEVVEFNYYNQSQVLKWRHSWPSDCVIVFQT